MRKGPKSQSKPQTERREGDEEAAGTHQMGSRWQCPPTPRLEGGSRRNTGAPRNVALCQLNPSALVAHEKWEETEEGSGRLGSCLMRKALGLHPTGNTEGLESGRRQTPKGQPGSGRLNKQGAPPIMSSFDPIISLRQRGVSGSFAFFC